MHARAKIDRRLSTANIVFGLNDKQINRIQRQISGEWKYDPSLDVLSIDESVKTADDRKSGEARLERSGSGWNLILTDDEMNIIEASYVGKDSREGERTKDGTEQDSYDFAKVPSVMTSTDADVRSGTLDIADLDSALADRDMGVRTTSPHQSTLKVGSACSLTHDARQNHAFIDSSGTNEDVLVIDQMVRTRDTSSPNDGAQEEDLFGLDCVDGPLAVAQHTKVRKQESLWDNIEIDEIKRHDSADPHSSGLNMIFGPLGATMGLDKNFRAPSPPPEPLYDIHASIEVMTTMLRTQARLVENLADHYVIPMKRRHKKGTQATLAEMARCMRIDRLLEVLEGAVWLEKKVVGWGETTGQEFNATQVQVMMTAAGGIRKTSDRLQALLGKKDGSNHSKTLSLTSDPAVETLISQIHDAVEELLLYVRSALLVNTEHVNAKKELKTRMEQQTNLQKIEVLLASLPQKYIPELEEDFR